MLINKISNEAAPIIRKKFLLEIMNGFILCVVRTYDISEIFYGVLFGSRIFNSDFRDFYNLL